MLSRRREPYFPSFAQVMTQAEQAPQLLYTRQSSRALRRHPYLDPLSRSNDRLMMTVDYRFEADTRHERWSMGITDTSTVKEMDTSEVESDNDHSADDTFHRSHWLPEFPFSRFALLFKTKLQWLGRRKSIPTM